MWGSTVQYKGEQGNYPLMGVEPDFDDLGPIPLTGGRWLHADDLTDEAKVCVIGENLINELFKERSPSGSTSTFVASRSAWWAISPRMGGGATAWSTSR